MTTIALGQTSSARTPYLSTFVLSSLHNLGYRPEVVQYAIYEVAAEGAPQQVWPADPDLRADVDTRVAPAGDCISPGRYAARWTVPPDATIGRYEIRWWHRDRLGDPDEYTFVEPFEVVQSTRVLGHAYAEVADFRAEGICRIDDATLHQKIVRASRLFEQYTGRTFYPAYKTIRADGRGHTVLHLGDPVIAIEQLYVGGARYLVADRFGAPYSNVKVYNRHVAEGLTDPDDRENPRIEFHGFSAFGIDRLQIGLQHVLVSGIFGYTDPVPWDGPPVGVTPDLVKQAVRLLVMRDLPKLWDVADREDAQKRWKLTGENTRDQGYTMLGGVDAATRGALVGGTTGDSEIDNIVILYRRGTQIGAA